MIEICNLNKSYGDLKVLCDISLNISAGEIYGLVGRSGAGKSTLLRCINGLEKYDSGSLKVDGEDISRKSERELRLFRREIGMIFQQFSLITRRTVAQNVALPLKCWGQKNTDARVDELLELVQITEKRDNRPGVLSGGQKQRVAIARALALNPKILLCDEATSALDPNTTNSVLRLLREINERLGITIIVVTHQMEVVKEVCQRIAIIEDGYIRETGAVTDMFLKKPVALRNFIGKEEAALPKEGVNLSFFAREEDSALLTSLARRYDRDIRILEADVNRFRDQLLTTYTINTPQDIFPQIAQDLDGRGIHWEKV